MNMKKTLHSLTNLFLFILAVGFTQSKMYAQSACNWAINSNACSIPNSFSAGITGEGRQSFTDANGNTFICSSLMNQTSNVTIGGFTLDPNQGKIAIVKYTNSGAIEWAINTGIISNSTSSNIVINGISVDALGNIYLTGFFSFTSAQFGGFTLVNNNDGLDIFVVKLDANGNVIWAKNSADIIGCGVGTSFTGGKGITGLTLASNGTDVYIGGKYISQRITLGNTVLTNDSTLINCQTAVTSDAFLLKLDSGGNFIWVREFKGKADEHVQNISINSSGQIAVLGQSSSNVFRLNGISFTKQSLSYTHFVALFNSGGTMVWAKSISGIYESSCIAFDFNGNIYFGGKINSNGIAIKLNTTNILSTFVGGGFLLKLNNLGTLVWIKSIGGDARMITTDSNNNIYISGNLDTGNFGTISLFPTIAFHPDLFVAQYKSNGTCKWAKNYFGNGTQNDYPNNIGIDNLKNVYLSGSVSSTNLKFGNTTINSGCFLAQIDTISAANLITPSGTTTFCQGGSVTLTAPLSAQYLWSNGATSQSIVVNQSGVYFLTNTCGSLLSNQINVQVKPLPIGTATNQTIGDGEMVVIHLNSSVNGTSFNYSASSTLGNVSGFSSGISSTSISQTLNGNGEVTYTVIPTAGGCTGSTFTVSATVSSTIPVGISSVNYLCSGNQTNVPLLANIPGTTFTYTSSRTWGTTIGNSNCSNNCGTSINQTLSGDGLVTYTVIPTGPSPDFIVGNPFNVSVRVFTAPPLKPNAIKGPAQLCGLTSVTFSVDPVANATSYSWILRPGMTNPVYNTIGNRVTVTLDVSVGVAMNGYLKVTANNPCGSSSETYINVYLAPPNVGSISGPTQLCGLSSATYTCSFSNYASDFDWTFPTGVSPSSITNTTNFVTITFPVNSNINGYVTVTPNNVCGAGNTKKLLVKSAPANPGPIIGPSTICIGIATSYSVAPLPDPLTNYIWSTSVNNLAITSNGTNSIELIAANNFNTSGQLRLAVANICASSTLCTKGIYKGTCLTPIINNSNDGEIANNTFITTNANLSAKVYPNPAYNQLNIDIETIKDLQATIEMFDVLGNKVVESKVTLLQGVTLLSNSIEELNKGIYLLRVADNTGNTLLKTNLVKQ
jgi:PKD-like domain/Secretion system C-terminal sorting domain